MKPTVLLLVALCSFAGGALIKNDDPKLEACMRIEYEATQLAYIVAECLNGGTIYTDDTAVRCRRLKHFSNQGL